MIARMTSRSVLVVFTLLFTSRVGAAQSGRLYRVDEVTTSGVRFSSTDYQFGQSDSVRFPELEIWNAVNADSLNFYYRQPPDWGYELLRRGFARIRADTTLSQYYHQVQDSARIKRLGLWRQLGRQTGSARDSDSTQSTVDTAHSKSTADSATAIVKRTERPKWVGTLLKILLGAFAAFSGYEFFTFIGDWFRRYRVTLILLGEPASGKSWLWHKLLDSNFSERDLEKLGRNPDVQSGRGDLMVGGLYTVVPQFVDLPGRQTGEQLSKLIDRRRFRFIRFLLVPQKRIWIIFLAPVGDAGAPVSEGGSGLVGTMDPKYVAEQLGYLALPEGVLASKDTPKPEMVIMCISKFDMFSAFPPDDSQSKPAAQKLESDFRDHITRIKRACATKGVPFEVLLTSARKGWGVDDVQRRIHTALFKINKERVK